MQIEVVLGAVLGLAVGVALTAITHRRTRLGMSNLSGQGTATSGVDDRSGSSREDLDDLIDQIGLGIVRLGARLEVVWVNRAAARLLRMQEARIAGRSVMELFVDHRVEEAARTAIHDGSASYEIQLRTDEDRRVLMRFRRAPGDGMWLMLEDVTELRRLQRIRTEFIDNLSHELRTPLTTIRLLTETLIQDMAGPGIDVPERVRERIQKIDAETDHLAQMVTELLDLSRIEGGAAELHFYNVRMDDVVNAAVERLRTFADRQLVGLETEFPAGDVPIVWGDEERLGQVLVNLLHNAVKFSPQGSVVTVSTEVTDGQLVVRVRDQGVGIAGADLDRIFERFYKVDKARQRGHGGTGLGLAIARHVVEGHGGRIWAESEEGRGSVFAFTIPLSADLRPA